LLKKGFFIKENMELSDEDLEYEKKYNEMFKDEEIEELVKKRKLNKKKKTLNY
jgi:hypothetical protein